MRLYFELPFGKLDQRQADIIALAEQLNRSPSSVAMKLVNFASLDPAITGTGRTGLSNNSKLDREVWDEFQTNWTAMIEATDTLSIAAGGDRENRIGLPAAFPSTALTAADSERTAVTKLRRGQDFFRRAVLANFDVRCCITGIAEPALLVASHIVPWQVDEQNRLNPRNGLALSATFDRAFDRGLITIDESLKIVVGERLLWHKNGPTRDMFASFNGHRITTPRKLAIDEAAILHHNAWARATNVYR